MILGNPPLPTALDGKTRRPKKGGDLIPWVHILSTTFRWRANLTNVATARTNSGVAIETNAQAHDSDFYSWVAKTATSRTIVGTSNTHTLSNKTFTSGTDNLAGRDFSIAGGLYRNASSPLSTVHPSVGLTGFEF